MTCGNPKLLQGEDVVLCCMIFNFDIVCRLHCMLSMELNVLASNSYIFQSCPHSYYPRSDWERRWDRPLDHRLWPSSLGLFDWGLTGGRVDFPLPTIQHLVPRADETRVSQSARSYYPKLLVRD